ncbi:hypothetical protein Godav_025992 [Gossypium davidsonii]|uniref:Uncharacterized protein n=1 Tax=Gossypium davidsonii TaxID=34287 RepID=A0A7J8TIS0_GOSDV|nr:hypothetical protein [Gossypium davidsonii]
MACPLTHIVVKGELKNASDDCLASLNYSNYQGAPHKKLIKKTIYHVATKIIPTKNHVVWEDIVSILQPYDSSDNLPLSCGGAFSAEAHIHANGDGSLNLTAQIMWSGCK